MTEIPKHLFENSLKIIFMEQMVLALGDGRKTQTRRASGLKAVNEDPDKFIFKKTAVVDGAVVAFFDGPSGEVACRCRYGAPGRVLYVAETFSGERLPNKRRQTGRLWWQQIQPKNRKPNLIDYIHYKADKLTVENPLEWPGPSWRERIAEDYQPLTDEGAVMRGFRWIAPMMMKRFASRFPMLLEGVEIERLLDISDADVLAEGIMPDKKGNGTSLRENFFELWDGIHSDDGMGTAKNPYLFKLTVRDLSLGV